MRPDLRQNPHTAEGGWAQIDGWRGEIDDPLALRRRVEHDLHYIETWSTWLDLTILALTPLRLFDGGKAY